MSVRWLKGHHCLLIKQATLRATPVGGWPQHTSKVSTIFPKNILEPPQNFSDFNQKSEVAMQHLSSLI